MKTSSSGGPSVPKIEIQNPFVYHPLQIGQIRLLHLLPDCESSPIRGSLETTRTGCVVYTALSWSWGTKPHDDQLIPITLNDACLLIWPSLHEALLAIRQTTERRTFWIDALCINQLDDAEKSTQIPLMKEIYSSADQVVIWLGTSADDSEFVMECFYQSRVRLEEDMRFQSAFFDLMRRRWFSRTWVLQELVGSAKTPLVMCGRSKPIEWTSLHRNYNVGESVAGRTAGNEIMQGLRLMLGWSAPGSLTTAAVLNMNKLRKLYEGNGQAVGVPLDVALSFAVNCGCTDPRDNVYGLLGLLEETTAKTYCQKYPIDYKKSVAEIFRETTEFVLTNDATVNLALYAAYRLLPQSNGTPSWVLDFSQAYNNRVKAIPNTKDSCEAKLELSIVGDMLSAKGATLDEVDELISFEEADLTRFRKLAYSWKTVLQLLPVVYIAAVHRLVGEIASMRETYLIWAQNSILVHELASQLARANDLFRKSIVSTKATEPLKQTLMFTQDSVDASNLDPLTTSSFDRQLALATQGNLLQGMVSMFGEELDPDGTSVPLLLNVIGRTLALGRTRGYGLVQGEPQKGDKIVLLFAPHFIPVILRPKGDAYQFVGLIHLPPKLREQFIAEAGDELQRFDIV